jgi:D-alanyl-D-alanine carboxypeptidase/D-alanyl-D-alanine carboxypeptidase (penicillin-binding protein 5/6)
LDAENHGSTAYEMALLTRTAIQNPDFLEICSSKTAKVSFGNPPFLRNLTNTNKLLTNYEGIIGVKTGFTDAAGRCLVSACERNGITIICVTLNDPDDWRDHAALYDAGFGLLKNTSIAPPEMKIDVVGGKSDQLELYVTENITVGTLPNNTNNVNFKVITPPFVYYPENSGEQVGFLEYYWDNLLIGRVPLYVKI